jgi:hypothetical protein
MGVGASSYQTNPHPARYLEARTDRARLEKLSIVRTLPNAPDLYLRISAVGSFDCHGRLTGKAHPGTQESCSRGSRKFTQDNNQDKHKAERTGRRASRLAEECEAGGTTVESAPGLSPSGSAGAVQARDAGGAGDDGGECASQLLT